MSRNRCGTLLACISILAIVPALVGAESNRVAGGYGPRTEEERQDAERIKLEDAQAEKTLGDLPLVSLEGKLYLQNVPNIDAAPWVIGHFSAEKRAYSVLLDDPGLFAELRVLNGQRVTLNGRLRVGSKYFVVTGIHRPVNIPAARPKRGGL